MGVFGTSKMKLFGGGEKIKKAYLGTEKIYSAGNIVTYYVDNDVSYQEEVDSDASCLNPTTFTPSKSGWAFVGWREDTIASGDVLSSKIMGDEPITLYAVFRQTVTVSYYQVSNSTKQQSTGNKYYNNGNYLNPSFTIYPNGYGSEWTFRGWTTGTAANASVSYSSISNREFTSDVTLYVLLQRPVTLTYDGAFENWHLQAMPTETKYVYLNSYNGNTIKNPTFTLASNSYSRSGYVFTRWDLGAVGATITLDFNRTAYAQWAQTVTNFTHNAGVQSYTVPVTGTYKLEVWGAKGGTQTSGEGAACDNGGNGGYSYGNVYLTAGQIIYICCGGYYNHNAGAIKSAYNGGGSPGAWGGHGGGATHIATTNRGVLSNYASYKPEVLIVAGGGGGSGYYCEVYDDDDNVIDDYWATGGSGGGATGGNGDRFGGQGATQSAGGKGGPGWQVTAMSGSFGQGGFSDYHRGGGGGGGWYGGGGGESCQGGGGGSGYIGGVTSGGMSNGVNAGQGKARITLI